jgi:hypothetical protein
MSEVLGPFQEMATFAKTTVSNLGGFLKGLGQDLGLITKVTLTDKKQLKEAEKSTGLLQKILDVFKVDKKEKFKEDLEKKKKSKKLGMFGMIALLLGVAIGAFIRAVIFPFEVLLQLPIVKKLKFFLTPLKNFLINLELMLIKIPGFGPLIKGIKIGFRQLFKPLLIIIALIDFISGFMATEGDIFDKIKGGLLTAVIKFLELPIRAFGWFLEKLGVKDATAKILQVVKVLVGEILDGLLAPFKLAQKLLGELHLGELVEVLGKTWDAVSGFFGDIWTSVTGELSLLWEDFKTRATATYDKVKKTLGLEEFLKPIEDLISKIKETLSGVWKAITDKLDPRKWWEGAKEWFGDVGEAFGLDKTKGPAKFGTKDIVSGVKVHGSKPVSEVGLAADTLSLAQERAMKRVAERMKTANTEQKEFLRKLIDKIVSGQADASKILVATTTNREGESKEVVSIVEDFAVVMEAMG